MSALFSKPKVPDPAPPPEVPTGPTEEEQKAAREAEAALERKKRGRGSTIFTTGSGLTPEANVNRKSLLGK